MGVCGGRTVVLRLSGRGIAAGGERLVLGHAPAIGAASSFAACAEPA